jgi:hypothetical protein
MTCGRGILMNIESLYDRYIKQIPIPKQLELISLISRNLVEKSKKEDRRPRSLLELEGLGAEIWEGVDAQKYVDELRDEWHDRP